MNIFHFIVNIYAICSLGSDIVLKTWSVEEAFDIWNKIGLLISSKETKAYMFNHRVVQLEWIIIKGTFNESFLLTFVVWNLQSIKVAPPRNFLT